MFIGIIREPPWNYYARQALRLGKPRNCAGAPLECAAEVVFFLVLGRRVTTMNQSIGNQVRDEK